MKEKQATENGANGCTSTGAPVSQEYAAGELQKGAPIVERTKIYFPEAPDADKKQALDLRYRYWPDRQSWESNVITGKNISSVHRLGTADNGMDILLCKFKSGVDVRDFGIFLGYVSPELK